MRICRVFAPKTRQMRTSPDQRGRLAGPAASREHPVVATDGEQARKDARGARYQAESRRTVAKIWLALAPIWVAGAVLVWISGHHAVTRWLWTAVAILQLVHAYLQWRVLRRPLPPVPGQQEGPGRELSR